MLGLHLEEGMRFSAVVLVLVCGGTDVEAVISAARFQIHTGHHARSLLCESREIDLKNKDWVVVELEAVYSLDPPTLTVSILFRSLCQHI